ncbi:small serum protein 2-like [Rhineura floridana]|uniref:small serum protein 2-like n=1 Tax=Rhineura floridana TaxID=261503 RepID=UPI002AC847D9|nr:small serum protein 2-like [Rhineura floridana]
MKVIVSLAVFCISLALCDGACFMSTSVTPDGCTDTYDGKKHPFGSAWNTAECMRCECSRNTMQCCSRYGGVVEPPPGCRAVVDFQACKYVLHKEGDPSKPCDRA